MTASRPDVDRLGIVRAWMFGVSWILCARQLSACRVTGECGDCFELVSGLLEGLS